MFEVETFRGHVVNGDCEACGSRDGVVLRRDGWQWVLCDGCRGAIEWWSTK